MHDPTSLSLIQRAAGNDQSAWEDMAQIYGPLIYHWCRKSGVSKEDSADVFQNVFSALSQNIAEFRREHDGAFRAWLWTITRNKIRDMERVRKGKAQPLGGSGGLERLNLIPDSESPAMQESTHCLMSNQIHRLLEQIKVDFQPATWRAFWRSTVDGQSPSMVAKELDVSLDCVYQAKSRILKRLRLELGDYLSVIDSK